MVGESSLRICPSHSAFRSFLEHFFAPTYDAAGLAGPRHAVSNLLRPETKARPLAVPSTPRLRPIGGQSAVDDTSSALA